ncbi:MAG: hypothetical protein U1E57_04280 [Paenacidovorax caeni]
MHSPNIPTQKHIVQLMQRLPSAYQLHACGSTLTAASRRASGRRNSCAGACQKFCV